MTEAEGGDYKCTIKNEAGEIIRIIPVTVQRKLLYISRKTYFKYLLWNNSFQLLFYLVGITHPFIAKGEKKPEEKKKNEEKMKQEEKKKEPTKKPVEEHYVAPEENNIAESKTPFGAKLKSSAKKSKATEPEPPKNKFGLKSTKKVVPKENPADKESELKPVAKKDPTKKEMKKPDENKALEDKTKSDEERKREYLAKAEAERKEREVGM